MKEALKIGLRIGVAIAIVRIAYSTIYGTHVFILKKMVEGAEKFSTALDREIESMKKADDDDDE